ncbi:MAG TPA: RuBisCO large subunit C-terminal-like domain-containing protein [Micropruina sp.]|nr:RuBisCO large subunit C-terminal-like domain-containing protein [Micropruina sp.]
MSAQVMLAELARKGDYLLATYALDLPADVDPWARVSRFAVGQTTGTWVEVPGLTDELRSVHEGRVVQVLPVPASDTTTHAGGDTISYLATLAFPTMNFGASLPQLLNTLIGNDASTSVEAKLVDLQLPGSLESAFGGPRFGIAGVRELTGVSDRPLLLNMLKPCTGLAPADAAAIFQATALGGIDLIKDDELMGNTPYSTVLERVKLFTAAADEAFDTTGVRTVYLPNISDRPDRMLETAQRAVEAGARALMVAYTTVGLGAVEALADVVGVPILGHFAGAAPLYEGPRTGMSAPLATGLLPRLAGADLALVVSPYGGYPITRLQYLRTAHQLSLPRPHLKPALPVIGGGVHPGTVTRFVGELGSDIVLGVGGAIQGHPDGAAAGVRAMRQAVDAALAGVSAEDAAKEHEELATALELWGTL